MSMTAVHQRKPPKDSYYLGKRGVLCRAHRQKATVACAPAPPPVATRGARELVENLRVPMLEREVAQLRSTVDLLMSLIDVDELRAMQRIHRITPDNDTLKLWVEQRSNSYPDLAAGPQERPW